MEHLTNNLNDLQRKRLYNAVILTIFLLAVFLAVSAVSVVKQYSYIGGGIIPSNTITVSGTGKVLSIPDVGSFSFSVVEDGKTVKEAQDKASKISNTIIDALKAMAIDEKDIKTVGYNTGPKYEYQNAVCPPVPQPLNPSTGTVSGSAIYCPPGRSVLTGYEVNQTISIKVRKTDNAGAALTKVGSLGATNISGLDFVIDDMDAVNAQARDKAITDAKNKASALAKSLGIKLVRIVSFSDSGNYPPVYFNTMSLDAKASSGGAVATPPEVPVGQNETVSNVSITYEIR